MHWIDIDCDRHHHNGESCYNKSDVRIGIFGTRSNFTYKKIMLFVRTPPRYRGMSCVIAVKV